MRDRDILHLITPLCLLISSYNYLRDDLEGHSITMRGSPAGAATLIQPVSKLLAVPRCVYSAFFHYSLSPL